MTYFRRQQKGFSFIEILVSMIILSIAVAATFASYVATAKLRAFSENELEAYYNAQAWLERVRTGFSSQTKYTGLIHGQNRNLNAANSILRENYNNWHMALKPKVQMNDTRYAISNANLGSGQNFKKITVTVRWDELD
jgi:prepilin-type N-terminal cleavage/methylation domain-containing protein